jgi:mRNA interferase RelE/StbE
MKINIRKSAIKDLSKLSHENKERLHKAIVNLKDYPNVSNCKKN